MKFPFNVIKQAKRRILNTSNRVQNPSSSSSSSSVSTSDSWTINLSPNLQRSETFIVTKQQSSVLPPSSCTNTKPQSSTPKISRVPIRIGSFLHRQINPTKKATLTPPTAPPIITRSSPVRTTSSESSNGEQQPQQQQMDKLLPIVQDEGYSTWSSIDVKDDAIKIDERFNTTGFVQNWIDLSNQPVNKGTNSLRENVTYALNDLVFHCLTFEIC